MNKLISLAALGTLVLLATIALGMWGCPTYNVWQKTLAGQAELKQAEWNRQIAVQEAHAKMEASSLLAQAEVERAKGVAQANKIIGESLERNESYLRYLWIQQLNQAGQKEVIYVPTEANLPILEAGRMNSGGVVRPAEVDHMSAHH